MRMSGELLAPRMQDTEEPNLGPEVSGIAGDFEKSFRAGTKQEIVDQIIAEVAHGTQTERKDANINPQYSFAIYSAQNFREEWSGWHGDSSLAAI
jgi:hypothetical protein